MRLQKDLFKKLFIITLSGLISSENFAQTFTLDSVITLARKNYPAIRQKNLVRKVSELNMENIGKGYLPQLSLNGQASYQSEVTKVDISVPGITIPSPNKDQYKFTADVNQLIFDGGLTKEQRTVQQFDAAVNEQQVEVEWHKVRDRLNQLYLNILYLNEQLKQVDLIKSDLTTGIRKVNAQVQNGIAFRSNLNILKAELIKSDQREIELRSSRKVLIETLGLFINQSLDENIVLQLPVTPESITANISRPELALFKNQSELLNEQNKIIHSRTLPKASLFAQGGYGRPGLNLLKNEFDFFYIGGIRFTWPLNGLYTFKNDKKIIVINQQMINIQKETFLLNTHADLKKQRGEMDKLALLINSDNEIIGLRKSITEASKAQLDNGVATASDYLREVNAEDQARQSLISHQLQLLQAQINYRTITGE
ncbi:MAG: TolC family protein [Flavitalea sp.]